jgi:hypothetical protein
MAREGEEQEQQAPTASRKRKALLIEEGLT